MQSNAMKNSYESWRSCKIGSCATLVHGYANPLTIRRFVKLAESPKVLKMLPYGRIRATRSPRAAIVDFGQRQQPPTLTRVPARLASARSWATS